MSLAVNLGYPLGREARIPDPLLTNLGVARVDAKGTSQDYLAHPSAIPGQIMALNPVFFGVVKTPQPFMPDIPGTGSLESPLKLP
jgi:hypothetical protein